MWRQERRRGMSCGGEGCRQTETRPSKVVSGGRAVYLGQERLPGSDVKRARVVLTYPGLRRSARRGTRDKNTARLKRSP